MSVQIINDALIRSIAAAAQQSPRQRMNHNFHSSPADNPHRFLNVLLKGTYVTPHRHLNPGKPEAFLVLEGYAAVFLFADDGAISACHVIGRGPVPENLPAPVVGIGVDLPPGVWHTVAVLTGECVCYEVKPGPWDPGTDKEFAPWAPLEGDPAAPAYLATLLRGL